MSGDKVKVHSFRPRGQDWIAATKRERAQIEQFGGTVVSGTEEEVDRSLINDNGQYDPTDERA